MSSLFFRSLTVVAAASCAVAFAASSNPAALKPNPQLLRLLEGNERFVTNTSQHPNGSAERRTELTAGQHPFAIVLACSDSRVSPEILFDVGLGDLFVVRNAGNLLDDHVLATIEYGVEHLHAPLLIVLGHTGCGAVTAAVNGGKLPGHLASIAESLAPAVAQARQNPGDPIAHAIRINARLSARTLADLGPIISEAVHAGHLTIVAARYDLATGRVEILE